MKEHLKFETLLLLSRPYINTYPTVMSKDKTKDGETATSSKTNRDHSRDQEARDATLAKTITEAVTREM